MKLNLEAKTKAQQLVREYLENNASPALAEKINGGAKVVKEGKTLINKKTLDGFMKYAAEEARKLAEKGATSACVEDEVVFGWAIHYFEEDEIEGTLFNEDGTEYKRQSSTIAKASKDNCAPAKSAVKPQSKPQISMFDMLTNGDNCGISPTQSQKDEEIEENLQVDRETGEIIRSAAKEPGNEERIPTVTELVSDYDGEIRGNRELEDDIYAVMKEPTDKLFADEPHRNKLSEDEPPEDEPDISAINREVLAELYMIFGDEITVA